VSRPAQAVNPAHDLDDAGYGSELARATAPAALERFSDRDKLAEYEELVLICVADMGPAVATIVHLAQIWAE
jgi:hypothetical protein